MKMLSAAILALLYSSSLWAVPPPPPPPPDFPVGQWGQYWRLIEAQQEVALSRAFENVMNDRRDHRKILDIDIDTPWIYDRRHFVLEGICSENEPVECELRLVSVFFPLANEPNGYLNTLVREAAFTGVEIGQAPDEWTDFTDRFVREFVDVQTISLTDCPDIIDGLIAVESISLRIDWFEIGEDDNRQLPTHPWRYTVQIGLASMGSAELEFSLSGVDHSQAEDISDAFLAPIRDCDIRALHRYPVGN